ncbi:hypothetical protein ANCCAN_07408 [Ancylostoma caninum]|uniref:Uncharacterized protein n=1 Tax=Ancylostoma caninum TaxID=29170 RepID=A0A368GSE5_ANCCA|nr:hypothetical protein ANCCAN_07408 [Ancylostoma caninum]
MSSRGYQYPGYSPFGRRMPNHPPPFVEPPPMAIYPQKVEILPEPHYDVQQSQRESQRHSRQPD